MSSVHVRCRKIVPEDALNAGSQLRWGLTARTSHYLFDVRKIFYFSRQTHILSEDRNCLSIRIYMFKSMIRSTQVTTKTAEVDGLETGMYVKAVIHETAVVGRSEALISLFRFRYYIDTILTKYCNIAIE